MGIQIKKKARSFSLTDEEFDLVLQRVKTHGFSDRNDYLLALVDADISTGLEAILGPQKQKLLRPTQPVNWMAAESFESSISTVDQLTAAEKATRLRS